MTEEIKIQYRLIEERFVKTAWTHKIHEKQADIYERKQNRNKFWLAFISSVTTTSAVATIFAEFELDWILDIITAILATISTYLTLRYKDNILEEKRQANKVYAIKCLSIRNKYESLLVDIKSGHLNSPDLISNEREHIEQLAVQLREYDVQPPVSDQAVSAANKALKINQETQTSDEEIQKIVPLYLQII